MRERLSPKMTAELCIITLCTEAAGDTVQGIGMRLSRLEEALKNGVPLPGATQQIEGTLPDPVQQSGRQLTSEAPEIPAGTEPEKPLPAENAPQEPDAPDAPPPGRETSPLPAKEKENGVSLWQTVSQTVLPRLPRDVVAMVPSVASGFLDGDMLQLEVEPGFYYGRFNRPDVLDAFAAAASEAAGRKISCQIRERRPIQKEPRSLDELRQFPEVRFK
jgi:hypothetical protein